MIVNDLLLSNKYVTHLLHYYTDRFNDEVQSYLTNIDIYFIS